MKKYRPYVYGIASTVAAFFAITVLWLAVGALIGALWPQAGFNARRYYEVGFVLTSRSGQIFWSIVVAACFGLAAFVAYSSRPERNRFYARELSEEDKAVDRFYARAGLTNVVVSGIAAGLAALLVVMSFTTDFKLEPRPFVNSITIEYADKDAQPRILANLDGDHDPKAHVKTGPIDFLEAGFDERPASLVGAQKVMAERSTGDSKADILDETYAYLPAEGGAGRWSAIRDGNGRRVHIDSIVEWDGTPETVHQCRFEGDHKLNYALTGDFGNSLADQIRREIPDVVWDLYNAYGYCAKGDVPTIVLPATVDRWYGARSIQVPAGVIVVRGSESGEPVIEYKHSVKAGELEGPVYPISVAQKQREMINWGAGRKWADASFGFDPVDLSSNKGNAADYVLRSNLDQQVYYATPLTPRASRAETIIALSVVASNQVTYGQFNPMRVQVHNEDDKGLLTEQDLERRARDVLSRIDPAFLNKGQEGELQEFIPAEDGTWSAFAVRSGQPRYLLRIRPGQLDQAMELNGGQIGRVLYSGTPSEQDPGEVADPTTPASGDLATLSDADLQSKLDATLDELTRLNQERHRRSSATG